MKLDGLDTPSVLVDVDIMTANLDRLARYCREHGLNLRPHIKTHKIPELAQLQVKKGAVGVTVAKLGEAEVMVDGGSRTSCWRIRSMERSSGGDWSPWPAAPASRWRWIRWKWPRGSPDTHGRVACEFPFWWSSTRGCGAAA